MKSARLISPLRAVAVAAVMLLPAHAATAAPYSHLRRPTRRPR